MKTISGDTRHIHLDFHTPPQVAIGSDFCLDEFFDTLQQAEVNSFAVFAHCHHGYCYFDTKTGVKHPGLNFDLFGDIAVEARKRGIKLLAYFSLNVNEVIATRYPDSHALDKEGKSVNSQLVLDGTELFWTWLCPNRGNWLNDCFYSPILEVIEKYPIDGLFIDMAGYLPGSCYCPDCKKTMQAAGMDINNSVHHTKFNSMTIQALTVKLREKMDALQPGLRLEIGSYFAYGEAKKGKGVISEFYLESLAYQTGWDYFPFAVRYYRNFDLPCLGFTGRFLKSWGDFGTMVSLPHMKYQLGCHLLAGIESAIGDHLPCNGKLEPALYKMIGDAFRFVKERQPHCVGMNPCSEMAIIMPVGLDSNAATLSKNSGISVEDAVKGAAKLATELHIQYEIYTHDQDYSKNKILVVADDSFSLEDAKKITAFANRGNTVIVCGKALNPIDNECRKFWHNACGITKFNVSSDDGEFYFSCIPGTEVPAMDHYIHRGAYDVEFTKDVIIAATKKRSPFVRTRETHYGHFHGPALNAGGAGAGFKRTANNGGFLIVGMELLSAYYTNNYYVHRQFFSELLNCFAAPRLISTNAPSIVDISLGEKEGKTVLQLQPFIADRRAMNSFESRNEEIYLANIWVKFNTINVKKCVNPLTGETVAVQDNIIQIPPFKEHLVLHLS
jgi:hypothetical protein